MVLYPCSAELSEMSSRGPRGPGVKSSLFIDGSEASITRQGKVAIAAKTFHFVKDGGPVICAKSLRSWQGVKHDASSTSRRKAE